jgi:hypothetical protein
MINPFGIGKEIGNKVIKPVVNTVAGAVWGIFVPSQDERCHVVPPKGSLALTPEARINLEDALRMGNKKEFVKRIKFWEKMLDLDPVRVAYAITTCLEAMKGGSTEAIRGACLNLLGSSFFRS